VVVVVPPDTLNPFASAAGVTPLIDLFFKSSEPVIVATGKPFTNILESTITFAFANNVSVMVALPLTYKEESILALSLSAFKFILFDNEMVSLPIRPVNMADVSEMFNFKVDDTLILFFKESILLDKEMVS
jgi:hypothetical protein